ncbi:MAG: retron St85 family RNA-directed DNA polymerase [Desulfobulbaceae bacterium]|nr:retron St85 family RNA-directed DNA polymerase [Desulfobulbaceae bacterium]
MNIIEYLSSTLSVDTERIKKYISTCPHRYKVYRIAKRNGAGIRIIAQPAKELKYLQKTVCDKYLHSLPVHKACMAYKKNTNIKDNALIHVKNNYLLKMDFKDFFPSINPSDLLKHIEKHLTWDICDEDKFVIKNLFFYLPERKSSLKLSIGAPTSPFISNTIMHEFDSSISEICNRNEISYSRYADDISFSTNKKDILFGFSKKINDTLKKCDYPNILINQDKTVFLSRKGNMHITGLVLTNDGKISIGRKKKRYIKSLVYKYISGKLMKEEESFLSGYLSFCWSVDSDFIYILEKKYGQQVIDRLRKKCHRTNP